MTLWQPTQRQGHDIGSRAEVIVKNPPNLGTPPPKPQSKFATAWSPSSVRPKSSLIFIDRNIFWQGIRSGVRFRCCTAAGLSGMARKDRPRHDLASRERIECPALVADHLLKMRHPLLEFAVVDRPSFDRRRRALRWWRRYKRLLPLQLDRGWPSPATTWLRTTRRRNFVAERRQTRQPEQPPFGSVSDLNGDSVRTEAG